VVFNRARGWSVDAHALLAFQHLAGNRAVGKLLRDARTKPVANDRALYFVKLRGDEPVTPEALADWVHRHVAQGKTGLEEQLLGSHEFTGSVDARRYWANYLRENFELLREISAEHLAATAERTRTQIDAERRRDAPVRGLRQQSRHRDQRGQAGPEGGVRFRSLHLGRGQQRPARIRDVEDEADRAGRS
jgi:hypothetical protein